MIEDLETSNDVPITDLVHYRKDAYRAANKEYLRKNFSKKDGNDYDLRQSIIKNCEPYYPDLFSDNDLVSKAFVDAEISKLPKPDPDVLKLDDSKAMQGSLDMNNQSIINLKMPLNLPDDCAINFKYLDSTFLNLKGTKMMEAKLDMHLFDIINLPTADSESSYAANVNYVNKTVSDNNASIGGLIDSKVAKVEALNIKASKRENVVSFVMDDYLFKEDDDDITKVGKVEKDFYDINQATYVFTIDYDSKIGYYSTRLTIDLKALDIGEFTLVFEMYYDSSEIEKDKVVVNALSSSLNVSRHNTNNFSDHGRTIINFHKYDLLGLNDLDINITLKNKDKVSYDPTATIFVVVYGVSGHQNDGDTRIWDRSYYVEKLNVKFEAAIDMNDHNIINVDNLSMNNFINMNDNQVNKLQDGNEDGDAVNVKQLNDTKLFRNEIATAVKGVYFHTRNPAYNTYSNKAIVKTMK